MENKLNEIFRSLRIIRIGAIETGVISYNQISLFLVNTSVFLLYKLKKCQAIFIST
jgi:hypothetical protein